MHDFLLAKEIVDELKRIAKEKNLTHVKRVKIEIGTVALAHDGFGVHEEDIHVENLEFGLESIAKNEELIKGTKFDIEKIDGENWKITSVEVE